MKKIIINSQSGEPSFLGEGDLVRDAWGLQKFSAPRSLFYGMFTFDVPINMWLLEENGVERPDIYNSTRAISSTGKLVLKSGTTLNDETLLESRRHPRYQPNRGHIYSCSAFLPNPTSGQVDFGLFVEDENGVFFRRKEDGKLYACLVSNSVFIREEEITIPFNIDLTKGNVYDIQMQWRGVGNIKFYVGNYITGFPELVHEFKNLNTLTELSIANPALSAGIRATNVSGSEGEIHIGCIDVSTEGGDIDKEQYASAVSSGTYSAGEPIMTIRSPSTINGRINTRDLRLSRLSANADKKSSISLWVTRDPTAITGGTWNRINQQSFIELNNTATAVDTNKMIHITTFNIEANSSNNIDNPSRDTIEFFLIHGDYLCMVCDSGSIVTMNGVIEWGEEV